MGCGSIAEWAVAVSHVVLSVGKVAEARALVAALGEMQRAMRHDGLDEKQRLADEQARLTREVETFLLRDLNATDECSNI